MDIKSKEWKGTHRLSGLTFLLPAWGRRCREVGPPQGHGVLAGVLSLLNDPVSPPEPCLLPLAHGCSLDKQIGPARVHGDSFRLHDIALQLSLRGRGDSCSLLGPPAYMCLCMFWFRGSVGCVLCFVLS